MIKQLSVQEGRELIAKGNVVIIDVRDDDSYRLGHIEGAVQLSIADMREFCFTTPKNQPILVYCYHGISSQSVAQHLQDQGFLVVYSLSGGFEKWQAHHHPTSDQQQE